MTSDILKLKDLIEEVKFAMMTTVCPTDGQLRSRPMTLQQTEFDGDLWFFAGKSTKPVLDISYNPKVNLSFANVHGSSYISVVGRGEIVKDKAKEKELWNPMYKAWFPEGLEDPELCLIKVQVESADYWENPSSTVVQLVGFAKAILSGEKASNEIGHHGHLEISNH